MSTSSINSFFKNNGITGNLFIDSLIVAHLIPIILSYINGLIKLARYCLLNLWEIMYSYTKYYFKAKLVGNNVCEVEINENNPIYNILKSKIFDSNIPSDKAQGIIDNYYSLERKGKKIYEDSRQKYLIKTNIDLNYSDKKKLFKCYNHCNMQTNEEVKIFKYKLLNENYIIKIMHEEFLLKDGNNKHYGIRIELISFREKFLEKNRQKYVNIIENFLKSRFNIGGNIEYIYNIQILDKVLMTKLQMFVGKKSPTNVVGWINYGDNIFDELKIDKEKTIFSPKGLVLQSGLSSIINTNKDYKKHMILYQKNTNILDNDTGTNVGGGCGIMSKYLSKVQKAHLIYKNSGFFKLKKKIFMICSYDWNMGIDVIIVSEGKLLTIDDLKEDVNFLIRLSLERTEDECSNKLCMKVYKMREVLGNWNCYVLEKRSIDTIYLPIKQKQEIMKEFHMFMKMETLYRKFQIPYRKGILFYGPPGTGKTSLIRSLAYEYQMNIYVIDVNDSKINDETIVTVLNSIAGNRKILLFEDIDYAFAEKEEIKNTQRIDYNNESDNKNPIKIGKENEFQINVTNTGKSNSTTKYLTYSGLLNALDGVMSNQSGVITILTTNNIDRLGEALTRPGRIDAKFELKECNDEQIESMINSFLKKFFDVMKSSDELYNYDMKLMDKKITELVELLVDENRMSNIRPCRLQQYLLKNIENPDNIFVNYKELLV